MRCIIPAALAYLVLAAGLAGAARAQPNTVVVPAGQAVVIPPRSATQALPRPTARALRARLAAARPGAIAPTEDSWLASAGPFLGLIPLAAAGVLAGTLPGSGGAAGGPARTR